MEKATFAAGCFWGVEAAFRRIDGVVAATVGYSGGTLEDPTYQDVCTGRTGHAEVVELEFEPPTVSYERLLDAPKRRLHVQHRSAWTQELDLRPWVEKF